MPRSKLTYLMKDMISILFKQRPEHPLCVGVEGYRSHPADLEEENLGIRDIKT